MPPGLNDIKKRQNGRIWAAIKQLDETELTAQREIVNELCNVRVKSKYLNGKRVYGKNRQTKYQISQFSAKWKKLTLQYPITMSSEIKEKETTVELVESVKTDKINHSKFPRFRQRQYKKKIVAKGKSKLKLERYPLVNEIEP